MMACQEFYRVSQSIHRMPSVLMMNSLPHLTIPQMSVAKILFPEILEKFILVQRIRVKIALKALKLVQMKLIT